MSNRKSVPSSSIPASSPASRDVSSDHPTSESVTPRRSSRLNPRRPSDATAAPQPVVPATSFSPPPTTVSSLPALTSSLPASNPPTSDSSTHPQPKPSPSSAQTQPSSTSDNPEHPFTDPDRIAYYNFLTLDNDDSFPHTHPTFRKGYLYHRPIKSPLLTNRHWPNLEQTATGCPYLASPINPASLPFPTYLPTSIADASTHTLTSDCSAFHALFVFLSHFPDHSHASPPFRFPSGTRNQYFQSPLPPFSHADSADTVFTCHALLPAAHWIFPPETIRDFDDLNFRFLYNAIFKYSAYGYYLLHHHLPFSDLPLLIATYNFFNLMTPPPHVLLPYPFHTVYHYVNARLIGPLPFSFYFSPMVILSLLSDCPPMTSFSAPFALYIRIYLLPLRMLCDHFYISTHPLEVLLFLVDQPMIIPYCSYSTFLHAVGPSADPNRIPSSILHFHTFVSLLQFPVTPHSPRPQRLINIAEFLRAPDSPSNTPSDSPPPLAFSLFQSALDHSLTSSSSRFSSPLSPPWQTDLPHPPLALSHPTPETPLRRLLNPKRFALLKTKQLVLLVFLLLMIQSTTCLAPNKKIMHLARLVLLLPNKPGMSCK